MKRKQRRASPDPAPADTRTTALHQEIATQAHLLWNQYGQPSGRDVGIWLEAERQVLGVDPEVRQQAGGPVESGRLNEAVNPEVAPPGGESEREERPR